MQRLYKGKNRTPYVKDAFHDHIIPSHRPKEPEPETPVTPGLPMKTHAVKTPKVPPHHTQAVEGEEDEEDESTTPNGDSQAPNGHAMVDTDPNGELDDAEHIVPPPPRPTNPRGARQFVNPDRTGTKAGAHYAFQGVPGRGGCVVVRLKMTPSSPEEDPAILDEELFDDNIEERRVDADEFYSRIAKGGLSDDLRNIMRQALSGMLWYVFVP